MFWGLFFGTAFDIVLMSCCCCAGSFMVQVFGPHFAPDFIVWLEKVQLVIWRLNVELESGRQIWSRNGFVFWVYYVEAILGSRLCLQIGAAFYCTLIPDMCPLEEISCWFQVLRHTLSIHVLSTSLHTFAVRVHGTQIVSGTCFSTSSSLLVECDGSCFRRAGGRFVSADGTPMRKRWPASSTRLLFEGATVKG